MKRQILGTGLCLIVAMDLFAYPHPGQNQAQHVISTKAGLIRRTRGDVFIQHAQSEEREPVVPDLQMIDGDRLATGFMSRAEILVNSAAYLRLDEESEARAVNTRLTQARFELLRGIFVIQAGNPMMVRPMGGRGIVIGRQTQASEMTQTPAFEIVTPHGILTIRKDGVYQIAVDPAASVIDIFEGEISLGDHVEALGNKAQRVKSGKRVRLTGKPQAGPAITRLAVHPFDQFDRWRFPIAIHGMVVRVEGDAIATWDPGGNRYRISPEFQLKEGQVLVTGATGYLGLRIGAAAFLYLNQSTRIRAVRSETAEAVYELIQGSIFLDSDASHPMRPIKIATPRGSYSVRSGSSVRFDVSAAATSVRVRRGEARNGAAAIGAGSRLTLTAGAPPAKEAGRGNKDVFDDFDRWSLGLLWAGSITLHEGRVTLARQGGAEVNLEKSPQELQIHVLQGAHLSTESGGRAALSAGAGAIHVNENSEIVAAGSSGAKREFEVLRGAAIAYVDPATGLLSKNSLTISTPQGQAEISGGGIVRFDVGPSGTTIRVRSGSLIIRMREAQPGQAAIKLREKQTAYLKPGASQPQISNVRDTPPDDFDQWSIGARLTQNR